MAVVDFRPRAGNKPKFDGLGAFVPANFVPRVRFNTDSINRGFRVLAHMSLCSALTLCTYQVLLGVERIQGYLAPYTG
ncbi:hypothetical protein GCM10007939_04190 [Amylibacter marinus]|uniref:Uncharacterized protein n=1 Tax=Amylibacter marinus TaxID=1475483 RepID=A0ABQ5VS80_9RHOB|nr:hypothetical protein [Amylibacter marinus]GLQ34136.1 hypothetical protein GCM10007939_04190 [Amylibacter marinus]